MSLDACFKSNSIVDAAARTSSLMGTLKSVICHRGQGTNHGHFVSCHNVTGVWYMNDDSRRYRPASDPLEHIISTETAERYFFAVF